MVTSSERPRENLLDLKPQSLLSVLSAHRIYIWAVHLLSRNNGEKNPARHFLTVALATFFLSVTFSLGSQTLLGFLTLGPALILLLVIVFIGIIFDIIGVAITAAREEPFHAMATDRVPGAQQAIRLIKQADKVASFALDIVGDVAGTLSGAIAAAIVVRISVLTPSLSETLLSTVVVALIASLMVTGKAVGKGFALSQGTKIIAWTGKLLYYWEKMTGIVLFANAGDKKRRKRSGQGKRSD